MKISAFKGTFATTLAALLISGCAGVRQQDLDAWVNMPVEALDTHSFFITVPVYKTYTSSGIEVRNYANGEDIARCFGTVTGAGSKTVISASQFSACTSNRIVCNNIFYIKDGRVLEYVPTGQCMTDDSVKPERRYESLMKK